MEAGRLLWKLDMSENESGIRLEFAQFGHFTSFDVIRSMVSMDSVADADLPTPIATGLKTMYYVDSDIVRGLTYYYRVRVWRGSESFVSSEAMVLADRDTHWDKVVSLLHFDDNVIDASGRLWQKIGDSSFGGGVFGSGLLLTRPNSNSNGLYSNGVVLDSDFTIEFFINSSHTADEQCIVSCYKGFGGTGYTWEVFLEKTTGILHFYHHSGTSGSDILISSNKIADGVVHHIAVTRDGSMMRLFIDGNLHDSRVEFREYTAEAPLCIGYQHGGGGRYPLKGMVDEFRITSGVARYTANFTPPTLPHLHG